MKTIDFNEKHATKYCIPLWLRDSQIANAIKKVRGRLGDMRPAQSEPIAVVGYGPSLNQTWEKIRDFKYVISCSGAHRFLIDRGIVPTWHAAVDPLPGHTVKLIGQPHPEVEYLIASTCHPDVFEHLREFNVKLWHVFDNDHEAQRTLPAGEWAICGGQDAGMRCLTLARFHGFTDLHIFGIDGSFGETGRHAGAHPVPMNHVLTEYPAGSEKMWQTTPAMLESAKGVFHELNQLKDCKATFYGDALVQEIAKHYVPQHLPGSVFIGMAKPVLITEEYRRLNAQLHAENPAYGVGDERHAETVLKLAESIRTKNILNYGSGKGRLARAIPFQIAEYDPAIPGKDESPKPADIVCCLDVLEHVEPECVNAVLADLKRCVKQVGYFVIHMGPAQKTLPDGRNTHISQHDQKWWTSKLVKRFEVGKIFVKGPELHVVVGPKVKKKSSPPPVSVVAECMQEVELV